MKKILLSIALVLLIGLAGVCVAGGLYGGGSSSRLPTRIYVSVTGISAISETATTLYTVPTGYTFYPTTVVIECTYINDNGDGAVASFGGNSATYDDYLNTQTYDFDAAGTFKPDAPTGVVVSQTAGDVFKIIIETASTSDSETWTVDLYGILK